MYGILMVLGVLGGLLAVLGGLAQTVARPADADTPEPGDNEARTRMLKRTTSHGDGHARRAAIAKAREEEARREVAKFALRQSAHVRPIDILDIDGE